MRHFVRRRSGTGSARVRDQVPIFLLAVPVALLVGVVVAQGLTAAAAAGLVIAAAGWAARPKRRRHSDEPYALAYWLVVFGLLTMTGNALRLSQGVTVSDAILVAAGIVLLAAVLARAARGDQLPRVPVWLLLGAGGLVVAALLVEMFPPSSLTETAARAVEVGSLYSQNSPLGPGEGSTGSSNAVVAARWTVALLCVPLLLGVVGSSWRRLRVLVNVWLVGVALNCGAAMLSWMGLFSPSDLIGRDYVLLGGAEADRFVGLTVHPTQLGTIAAVALPVVVVRLAHRVRAGDVALAVAFVLGIMLAGSRAPLLGAVVGVAAAFAIKSRLRIKIGAVAFGVVLIGLVATITSSGPFAIVARLSSDSTTVASSNASRANVYADTVSAIVERPFVGYGFDVSRVGHSLYLGLLEAGGVIALAAFVCFAAGLVRTGLSLVREARVPTGWHDDAAGLTAAVIGWLALSAVQNSVFDRFLYIPAGLLIALAYNARGLPASSAATVPAEGVRTTSGVDLIPRPARA